MPRSPLAPGAIAAARTYIAKQQLHHAKHSFTDELKELLVRAGVGYEEKYLH
jgi:hypothetical protein